MKGFCIPVWPFLAVTSSLSAPGLCHVTGPSISRSQLMFARRAAEGTDHIRQSADLCSSFHFKMVSFIKTCVFHSFACVQISSVVNKYLLIVSAVISIQSA